MNSPLFVFGALGVSLIAFVFFLRTVRHAPEGYEDERGFHYGPMPDSRHS